MQGLGQVISLRDSYAAANESVSGELAMQAAVAGQQRQAATKQIMSQYSQGGMTTDDVANAFYEMGDIETGTQFREEARAEKDREKTAIKEKNILAREALDYAAELEPRVKNQDGLGAARDKMLTRYPSLGESAGKMFDGSFEDFDADREGWNKERELTGDLQVAEDQYQRALEENGPDHPLTKAALKDRDYVEDKRKQTEDESQALINQRNATKDDASTKKEGGIAVDKVNGNRMTYWDKADGRFHYANDGKPVDDSVLVLGANVTSAKLNDFAPTPAMNGLREKERDTLSFRQETQTMVGRLERNHDAITVAGDVARVVGSVVSDARGLANYLDMDFEMDGDDAVTAESFDSLKTISATFQTAYLNYALAYAKAAGLGTGRALTDKDLKLALEAVGAGTHDWKVAIVKARESSRLITARYKIDHQNITKEKYLFDGETPLTEKEKKAERAALYKKVNDKMNRN